MRVITLRALADNYIFLLLDDEGGEAAAVDPGDAAPVVRHLQDKGFRLTAILNTHHHTDHTGGNRTLLGRFPDIRIYGSAGDRGRIPGQTDFLAENDEIVVCRARARVLNIPGHTRGHIAYHFAGGGDLFSGDTIFGGTIGNIFEGTVEEMFQSVRKIRELPCPTRIWCSHEYTLQYVRESARIDPENELLAQRLEALEAAAGLGIPTVPLLLEEERRTNPFLRWDDLGLAMYLKKSPGIAVFRHLCDIT